MFKKTPDATSSNPGFAIVTRPGVVSEKKNLSSANLQAYAQARPQAPIGTGSNTQTGKDVPNSGNGRS